MQDALSWDRNPPNFTLDFVSYYLDNLRQLRKLQCILYYLSFIYILRNRIPECSIR